MKYLILSVTLMMGCSQPGPDPDPTLTFNERVTRAVDLVASDYPDALLYEADGTADAVTTDPSEIAHLRVVFDNDNKTILMVETAVGVFGKPVLIDSPWCEDVVIPWPIGMDLPKANELKEAAGHTDPYGAVTLRNPLGPTVSNPSFIFGGNPTQPYIWVDTVTGAVTGSTQ